MSVTLYEASVPVFLHYLERLLALVNAAEAFAQAQDHSLDELLTSRLAPDMLPFERQVAVAAYFSLRSAFPLAGAAIPEYVEFPASFAGLRARIAWTAAQLRTLQAAQFASAELRIVESQAGAALLRLPAPEFLFQYAMPNFFFHLSTAYAIIRQQGAPIGKADFDAYHSYPK